MQYPNSDSVLFQVDLETLYGDRSVSQMLVSRGLGKRCAIIDPFARAGENGSYRVPG